MPQPCRRASMAPAWSMYERMTPPKMVPCALVSRGIMSTRMAGSFHFGCGVTGSRGCEVTPAPRPRDCATAQPRSQSGLLLRRLLLDQAVVELDAGILAQPLQQCRTEIARLLEAHRLAVREALVGRLRVDLLLLEDLEHDRPF